MKLPYFIVVIAITGLFSYLTLAEADEKSVAPSDVKFAQMAALAGMTEIETGNMAMQMGASPAVKSLGEMMVKSHTELAAQLKTIAAAQGIELPATLDAKHQAIVDALKKTSGAAFDKLYANDMVAGHKDVIAHFKTEAKDGKNAALKAFAEKTIPILEGHLKHAVEVQAGLKQG